MIIRPLFKTSLVIFLMAAQQISYAASPDVSETMLNDVFSCKSSFSAAKKVYEYLYDNKGEMTEAEAKKLDFPLTFDTAPKLITVNGQSSRFVNTMLGGEEDDDFINLELIIPSKNSLTLVEDLAKKLNGKPDEDYNSQAKAFGLNTRSYTIYEDKSGGYERKLYLSNTWKPDEKHNPWPMIEFSCQMSKIK